MPANLPIARPAASITATPSAASAQPPLSDTIVGGDGTDRNDLITEAHQVSGYGGSDTIFGTEASDDIAGYDFGQMGAGVDGRDELHGGKGADLMSGNAGNDILFGGVNNGGVDTMYGDAVVPVNALDGDDILVGDNGFLDFTFDDSDRMTLDLIRSTRDGLAGSDCSAWARCSRSRVSRHSSDSSYSGSA